MTILCVDLDLANNVFALQGSTRPARPRRCGRPCRETRCTSCTDSLPPGVIGLEA